MADSKEGKTEVQEEKKRAVDDSPKKKKKKNSKKGKKKPKVEKKPTCLVCGESEEELEAAAKEAEENGEEVEEGADELIALNCHHHYCAVCFKGQLDAKWTGARITFSYLQCGLCRKWMMSDNPKVFKMMESHFDFRHLILELARIAFKDEGEELVKQMQEKGKLSEDPDYEELADCAAEEMAFFMCGECKKPFCGGRVSCAEEMGLEPQDLYCKSCSWTRMASENDLRCKKHGYKFALFKCDSCCAIATFDCFRNHYCNRCHDLAYVTKDFPCPGQDKCPLGIPHPPNVAANHGTRIHVTPFVIGCTACVGFAEETAIKQHAEGNLWESEYDEDNKAKAEERAALRATQLMERASVLEAERKKAAEKPLPTLPGWYWPDRHNSKAFARMGVNLTDVGLELKAPASAKDAPPLDTPLRYSEITSVKVNKKNVIQLWIKAQQVCVPLDAVTAPHREKFFAHVPLLESFVLVKDFLRRKKEGPDLSDEQHEAELTTLLSKVEAIYQKQQDKHAVLQRAFGSEHKETAEDEEEGGAIQLQGYGRALGLSGKDGKGTKSEAQKELAPFTEPIQIIVLTEGDGRTFIQAGDKVKVHYTGRLRDGTVFDTSRHPDKPQKNKEFEVVMGEGKVIQGWELGLLEMTLGQRSLLRVQSDLAYGDQEHGKILPGSDLEFDIEIMQVNDSRLNTTLSDEDRLFASFNLLSELKELHDKIARAKE